MRAQRSARLVPVGIGCQDARTHRAVDELADSRQIPAVPCLRYRHADTRVRVFKEHMRRVPRKAAEGGGSLVRTHRATRFQDKADGSPPDFGWIREGDEVAM